MGHTNTTETKENEHFDAPSVMTDTMHSDHENSQDLHVMIPIKEEKDGSPSESASDQTTEYQDDNDQKEYSDEFEEYGNQISEHNEEGTTSSVESQFDDE